LLEFPSPSRRIFIASHSLRPLSDRQIGPSVQLQTLNKKVSGLAALKHVLEFLLELIRFLCILSNILDNSARSSSPSSSKSLFGKDTREYKEYIWRMG
jgi:hypothetical protein